jgi:hypothetical protein
MMWQATLKAKSENPEDSPPPLTTIIATMAMDGNFMMARCG